MFDRINILLFKFSQVSIEPENSNDHLGKTFKDLQGFVQDRLNKSTQDMDTTRTRLDKTDMENQSLREQLKHLEGKLNKRDEKVKNEKAKVRLAVGMAETGVGLSTLYMLLLQDFLPKCNN